MTMQIDCVNNINIKNRYNTSFSGIRTPKFNRITRIVNDEFVKQADDMPDMFQKFIDEVLPPISKEESKAMSELYMEFQRENEMIFRSALKPEVVDIAQNITDLPTYDVHLLPFLTDHKKFELEYLYNLAKKRDILGEMRIPGDAFPYFSEIPYERMKILEPLMVSKNDAGMWNYSPSYIWSLDNKYSNEQLEIMSRLSKYKVNGMNLREIAENPYLNHWSIVEKSKSISELFGKDLREISFFSTSWGDNFISIDVQLPHKKGVPDYQNFKRIYARVGTNEQPKVQKLNTPKIDKYIKNIYTKLEDKLCVFTPEKLDKSINVVLDTLPWAKEIDVLRVMQKLTQFASYNFLGFLSEELAKSKVHKIPLNGGLNSIFNYFSKEKSIINLPIQKGEKYEGIFVVKDDLKDKNFQRNIGIFGQYGDIKFFNLEGWSDGINLFTDDNLLAKKTVKVLENTRKLMEKHPEYSFNEALDESLNGKIKSYLLKNKIKCQTISLDAPATRRVILEQMRPIMPNETLLKSTVESVANYYTKSRRKREKLSLKIAKYYDEYIDVYSKQRMIENLKDLKLQVKNYAKTHNISKNNIYIAVPVTNEPVKSFDVVAKMFAPILEIPKERILRISDIRQLNSMPENSAFIIADDVSASGYSMADAANYINKANALSKSNHILFCPVTAATEGINYVNDVIRFQNRYGIDAIFHAKNGIRNYDNTTDEFIGNKNKKFYKKVFGIDEDMLSSFGMCTSFPYMAPDNNSNLSSFLLKFFTPGNDCIKNKSLNFSHIEKNVYYYNIFGTDEKHVMTRLEKENPLYSALKDKINKFFDKIF